MLLTPQPNDRVLHVQPLIKTQGFYEVHPQPSPWVLYGSPKTFMMGFMWLTRNLHRGFYDNPFRETKGFNIHLITSINQSEFYVDYTHQPTFSLKKQTTNLFTVWNYQHHIQLDKHRPYILLTC